MIYTDMVKKALRIAYDAHHTQTDKTGLPYIYHPVHLAEHIGGDEAVIAAALLHDVVEDTDITFDDLRAAGISEEVIAALKLLTHDETVPYMDYVRVIRDSGNKIAIAVKLADLRHNSDTWRLGAIDDKARARLEKYKAAMELLGAGRTDDLENLSFDELLKINCFSEDSAARERAAELLEWRHSCQINCADMDESVLFAHHARGCTVVAAKLCKNVVIFQNVTIGSNQRYNKVQGKWENIGTPILAEGVIVADGAKVLGPIVVGENTVIGAGAIITKDVPPNSVAYGVNQYKPKSPDYDLIFNTDNVSGEEIMRVNAERVAAFDKSRGYAK
jgi:serine O-acetyltransferase